MDVNFQLKERTALITGPFSTSMQKIVMDLCALGADCFLVVPDDSIAKKFCQSVNDLREVNRKQGRAAAIKNELKSDDNIKDAIGEAVKSFGSVDLYIDMTVFNRANEFKIGEPLAHLDSDLQLGLRVPILLSHGVLNFFKSRQRGRILFVMNEINLDPIESATRGALIAFAKTLSKQASEYNVTVNAISLGLTEEWILKQYPQAGSIKEAVTLMREKDSSLKITEPDKIASTVTWLMGQYGSTVTGQFISLK